MSRWTKHSRVKKKNKTGGDASRKEKAKVRGKKQTNRKSHDTKGNNRRGNPPKRR